jgi:glycosyltransferase involved in cell wall biosynthesis
VATGAAPIAAELADSGAAVVTDFRPEAIADAIGRLLDDGPDWRRRRRAALKVAETYDWGLILPAALSWIGFD